MTRKEAIEVIGQDIPCEHDTDLIEALKMAISALERKPCNVYEERGLKADTIIIDEEAQKPCEECRNYHTSICGNCEDYDEYEQKPCEDAVSRQAVLEYLKSNVVDFPDYHEAIEKVIALPSVTVRQSDIEQIRAEISRCKTQHETQISERDVKSKLLISDIFCDVVEIIYEYTKGESE